MEYLGNKLFTHLENRLTLDQNFNILKRKLADLNAIKEDNESIKSSELQQPRKKLKKQVEIWFQNVERINGEIQSLEAEVQGRNVLSRGFLVENVSKKIQEVEELVQRAKSFDGLVIDEPQWIGQALLTTKLFGEAAEDCMKAIWGYLMGDDVSKIGVVGMGGVGKTTIMKLINNQLLKETEKFNSVIWVTVSKEVNIFNLQTTIARALNASLSEDKDETVRAGEIGEMLGRKGKYVIILDDLWDEQFSLEDVGILEPSNGCKLLVTTRSSDVCRNLDCREVKLSTLSKADAWSLFLEKVGEKVLNKPELLPHVKGVAEKCGGLPLSIVTTASGMRGVVDIHEWRNALSELQRNISSVSKREEKVFQQLRFSYDLLRNERLKQCFLCCAWYPEDYNIDIGELVTLWIAEGHVEEMQSELAEIDKGHTILNTLKKRCLVGSGSREDEVKLHDVMRDMALRIQSESGKPRLLVKAGMQLRVMPDVQEWNEDLEKVSLMDNWKLQIPPQMRPNCQKLTTLLLSDCNIESIPDCFFEHLQGLKVLDLSRNMQIISLPNSISNLKALTTLLLRGCSLLFNVPSLSKLQALKKLDLQFTAVTFLADEILEKLVNLRYIRLAFRLGKITGEKVGDGIFTKLACLRHLEISSRYIKGGEIGGLRNLEYFQGSFFDLNEFSCYVDALLAQNRLPVHYSIYVGSQPGQIWSDIFGYKSISIHSGKIYGGGIKILSDVENLEIVKCNSVELGDQEKGFFGLFKPVPHNTFSSLYYISIRKCNKIKKLFPSIWVLQNLQNLKKLRVKGCIEMEEIIAESESEMEELQREINTAGTIKSITLPKIHRLHLEDLPELKSICSAANGVMVCESIHYIDLVNCPKLKRLPQPTIDPFPNLQEIAIKPIEQWDQMEWDHPNTKSDLQPKMREVEDRSESEGESMSPAETEEEEEEDGSEPEEEEELDTTRLPGFRSNNHGK